MEFLLQQVRRAEQTALTVVGRYLHVMNLSLILAPDNGTGTNFTEGGMYELSDIELGFWFGIYGMIAFLAVFGNILVIYIILSQPRMQTVTNYFILNLAVGDTLTGMLAIPFKFQAALLQQWRIPLLMCPLVTFIETTSLSVSVFTLSGTAIDRFRAVMFPNRPKMTKNVARLIIFFIWVVSIACSTPYGMYHSADPFIGMDKINVTDSRLNDSSIVSWRCTPKFGEQSWWKAYNVYLTMIQYFVPLFIINGAYCVIGYKVWATPPMNTNDPRAESFERSKRRVIKMLVIVVMVFTFCWLPYETYLVLNEVKDTINEFYYINVLFFCCHWLAMSNSCLNPIIYGIYNEKFQKEYKRIFQRCFRLNYMDMQEIQLEPVGNNSHHSPAPPSASPGLTLPDSNPDDNDNMNSCHYYIASELGKEED